MKPGKWIPKIVVAAFFIGALLYFTGYAVRTFRSEVTTTGQAIFGGGELLKNKDGVIVGAVGVSGGSVAEDTNVAKAGVAAFK